MGIRDLVMFLVVFGAIPFILRQPAIGVMYWVWLGLMNPHRLAYGAAHSFQFSVVVAGATILGLLFTQEERRFKGSLEIYVLIAFVIWMSVTTIFAFDFERATDMWIRVIKVQFMILVALIVLHSRRHLDLLIWVTGLSVAFYGVKGGVFTILSGGQFLVWGPEGSFIEDNNALALAQIMTIPLLYYLLRQTPNRWLKLALLASIFLCAASALGSHSRGGLLAIAAMGAFLWLKSPGKLGFALALVLLVPLLVSFMPREWENRMRTISEYETDSSAQGRINSWKMATNVALDRPLIGGGFELYNKSVFSRYAPNPDDVHSAHSIYFQVLGEHGFAGLSLFLLFWVLAWRCGSWIIKNTRDRDDLKWAASLASMIHVSLIGYAVGGLFLNLGYWDMPYYTVVALVLTRDIVKKELAKQVVPDVPRSAPLVAMSHSRLT